MKLHIVGLGLAEVEKVVDLFHQLVAAAVDERKFFEYGLG